MFHLSFLVFTGLRFSRAENEMIQSVTENLCLKTTPILSQLFGKDLFQLLQNESRTPPVAPPIASPVAPYVAPRVAAPVAPSFFFCEPL